MILAEERTTDEEKMHIINARRRAARKKKMKKIGKSKSTDTEDEDLDDDLADDGKLILRYPVEKKFSLITLIDFTVDVKPLFSSVI